MGTCNEIEHLLSDFSTDYSWSLGVLAWEHFVICVMLGKPSSKYRLSKLENPFKLPVDFNIGIAYDLLV